jgi:hypothetical protein
MTTGYIQNSTASLDVKAALEQLRTDAVTNNSASAVQTDLDATEATIITDLGNLRTAVIAALTAIDLMATMINADAGTVGTDFITTNAAASSPAAVTTA